jgi:phospholipid-transporting ATPase
MIKELFEDLRRYKSDQEINHKKALILNPSSIKFEEKNWEDINVGDVTKVIKNDDISSDILLIRSSFDTGLCFVDTMNLDGETNLKEKLCPGETRKIKEDIILNMKGEVLCEKPNENLEKIDLSLTFLNMEIAKSILCGTKQLLLKGSKLMNTEYIYGIVVYTGHETKIMKNAKSPPMKQSSIMIMMNKLLYSVLAFQLLLCTVFSIFFLFWQNKTGHKLDYLKKYDSNFVKSSKSADFAGFILEILTFIVAYSHLIPISLYVALEFVKIAQSLLIYYDINMEDSITKVPAIARTSDLIEELGQVEFVFSDKTGTLTRNEMEFRKCSINYKIYGEKVNDSDSKKEFTLNGDATPYEYMISNDPIFELDKEALYNFFSVCAICHSAYIDNSKGNIVYQVFHCLNSLNHQMK